MILGHVNLITGFLLAILTGLGVNYGIHFLFRYNEEIVKKTSSVALKHAFVSTGRASLTGAFTTAISFITLGFSKFRGFSEFGLLASIGIMITLLAIYVMVTAFVIIKNKYFSKTIKTKPIKKMKLKNENKSRNGKKIILTVFVILIIFTGLFLLQNKKY